MVAGYGAALVTTKLLVLLTNFMLAYALTDAEFGYVSLLQALFLGAIGVFGFSAQSAYTRYTHEFGAGAVLDALVPMYVIMLLIAALMGFVTIAILGIESPYSWLALLPIAGLTASHLISGSAIARVSGKLTAYASGEIARPGLLLLAMLIYFVLPVNFSIGPFFICALLFSSLCSAALSWKLQANYVKVRNEVIPTKKVILYVAPLFVMQLVALANNVSDRFFIAAWFSIEEVGIYSRAYLVGSVLGTAFDSLSLLWAPYVVKNRDAYATRLHHFVRRYYMATWVVATGLLGLAWTAPRLSLFVYCPFNAELITLVLVVAAAFVMRTGYQVYVPVLSAFDMTPVVARLALTSAIIGLVSNIILIYLIGSLGAGLATLLAFSAFSIGAYMQSKKALI